MPVAQHNPPPGTKGDTLRELGPPRRVKTLLVLAEASVTLYEGICITARAGVRD